MENFLFKRQVFYSVSLPELGVVLWGSVRCRCRGAVVQAESYISVPQHETRDNQIGFVYILRYALRQVCYPMSADTSWHEEHLMCHTTLFSFTCPALPTYMSHLYFFFRSISLFFSCFFVHLVILFSCFFFYNFFLPSLLYATVYHVKKLLCLYLTWPSFLLLRHKYHHDHSKKVLLLTLEIRFLSRLRAQDHPIFFRWLHAGTEVGFILTLTATSPGAETPFCLMSAFP